eukprot:jgi/Botrbrau1/21456/Bobra.0216s0064.1
MVDAMRAMLDELMGRERDVPLDERTNRGYKFSDPEVCKHALAGLCPYGLFKNTKSDLGPCKFEIHEEDLAFEEVKAEWDKMDEKEQERYGYPQELYALLQQLVKDMDRKIERQKERAVKESEPRLLTPAEKEQLAAIMTKEKEALALSESKAEEGDVDGAMLFAKQAEAFSTQHETLHKQLTTPDRVMTVCEVCGVFINLVETDRKGKAGAEPDHLTGKQYLGWFAIREKLKEMKAKYGDKPPAMVANYSRDRERSRDRDRERDRQSNRERDRDRERERERGQYDRRERDYGSRGRERDYRDRERDRYGREPPRHHGPDRGYSSGHRAPREYDRAFGDRR